MPLTEHSFVDEFAFFRNNFEIPIVRASQLSFIDTFLCT